MAEQNPATPPASSGGPSEIDKLTALVAAQANALSAVTEQLGKLTAQLAPTEEPKAQKAAAPLTAEDVAKIVADSIKQHSTASAATAARQGFIQEKLKDLPAIYHGQLGNDPTQWPAEEQKIRSQFQADFKAAGGKVPDVGGGTATGATAQAGVDLSKMTAMEKIAAGVKALGTPTGINPVAAATLGQPAAAAK